MSEQIDTAGLRRLIFQSDITDHLDVEINAALDELDTLRTIIANEAHDWSEAHDLLLAATGTVVDEGNVTGQPTLIELVAKLTAERDALRELVDAKRDGTRYSPSRDELGRRVRDTWIRWAKEQPKIKLSWLTPYDKLSEADKEADRQIGEDLFRFAILYDSCYQAKGTDDERTRD